MNLRKGKQIYVTKNPGWFYEWKDFSNSIQTMQKNYNNNQGTGVE